MSNTDESLVLAAQCGDGAAFDELVRRHYESVLRRITRILGNRDDALEVAQDVFLKAYRSIDQVRDGRTVRSWLGMIGVRLALNRATRDRSRQWQRLDEVDPIAAADPSPDVVEEALRVERLRLIREAIPRLSPAQRTAFHLRHFEQMPFRDVGEWMGNSEQTARVLYFQAIRKLRLTLEES